MLDVMQENVSAHPYNAAWQTFTLTVLIPTLQLISILNCNFLQLPPTREIRHPVALPESSVIAAAREAAATGPSVQNIAMQAQVLKQEKLKEFQQRKEAAELKKLQDVEKKTLEKQARAAERAQQRKEATEQRRLQAQLKK